jgi:hypothetical protein
MRWSLWISPRTVDGYHLVAQFVVAADGNVVVYAESDSATGTIPAQVNNAQIVQKILAAFAVRGGSRGLGGRSGRADRGCGRRSGFADRRHGRVGRCGLVTLRNIPCRSQAS